MTVYEALNQIETKSFVLFGTDAFQDDTATLDTENDRRIYNLIKDVCSLHAKISANNIEFQPSINLLINSSKIRDLKPPNKNIAPILSSDSNVEQRYWIYEKSCV